MAPYARISLPRAQIAAFCRDNRIRRMAIFGSALREDFQEKSDIDVLIEFEPGTRIGLLGLARLQRALGNLLGRNVDLCTPGFLSPHFRDEVLREAQVLYEQAD